MTLLCKTTLVLENKIKENVFKKEESLAILIYLMLKNRSKKMNLKREKSLI